jgi:hypothetical protein
VTARPAVQVQPYSRQSFGRGQAQRSWVSLEPASWNALKLFLQANTKLSNLSVTVRFSG